MNHFRKMAYPYVAWISVMVVAPMLLIVMYAFIEQGNDVTTFRFTLSNFTRFFSDSVYTDVLTLCGAVNNGDMSYNRLPHGIYNRHGKA